MSDVVDTMQITRIAYDAYGETVDWQNYRGDPMPKFDELPERIRNAWRASTAAAIDAYERATTTTAKIASTPPPAPAEPPEAT